MPIKLFPHLRLLNPSLPVTRFLSMNLKPSIGSSRAVPALRQMFPFKLKYLGFGAGVKEQQLGVRKLSTRPFRAGSRSSSEFSRNRDRGRGGEIRASKSLIDDEAELNDWVSELGSDSFGGNKRCSKDDGVSDFGKARSRKNSRGRDGDSFAPKRRRESGSEDFYESNRRVNQNPVNSFSRDSNSRSNRRFNSDLEDGNRELYWSKKNRGLERGDTNSFAEKRNERKGKNFRTRFSDDDDGVGEERGRVMSGIKDLLGVEVSDVDDDDDSALRKNARSSIGLDKENGEKRVISPGKYDSYLSEARYVVQKIVSSTFKSFTFCR